MTDDTSSAEALRVRIQQPVFWLRQERQYLPWQFCIIGDKIPFDPDLINQKRKEKTGFCIIGGCNGNDRASCNGCG